MFIKRIATQKFFNQYLKLKGLDSIVPRSPAIAELPTGGFVLLSWFL